MITNIHLVEEAKAFTGESFTIPTHLAVATTEVANILATDTALSGEVGTRVALTTSRSDKTTSYSAIRSGTNVIDTVNGDSLESSGIFSASTAGDFHIGVSHTGIIQTTSFDLEFVTERTPRRV